MLRPSWIKNAPNSALSLILFVRADILKEVAPPS